MNIADELREYARDAITRKDYMAGLVFDLNCIADRIDAAHEEAYDAAYQDGENAILAIFDKRGNADTDERMADYGLYRVLDADKKPIHLGDVMVCCDNVREVAGVGKDCFFAWSGDDGRLHQYDALLYSHYEPPTVEDVLQEFARRITGRACLTARPDIIAEYADKLQLKED